MKHEIVQKVIEDYVIQYVKKVEEFFLRDIARHQIENELIQQIGLCSDWMLCSVPQRYAYTHYIAACILYRRSWNMRRISRENNEPLHIQDYEQTRCEAATLEEAGGSIFQLHEVEYLSGAAFFRLTREMNNYRTLSPRADGVSIEVIPIVPGASRQ